jgi:hypothetical protein
MEILAIKNEIKIDEKFDSTLDTVDGINDIENQTLTLDIVCKFCGDKRATVTIKYKSMKDQGYFRAVCVCEKCQ